MSDVYGDKKGVFIIAGSGCGKTYFTKHSLNWLDLDTCVFDKFFSEEHVEDKIKLYLNYYHYNIITNNVFFALRFCNDKDINIKYVIIPSLEMKKEILNRIKSRDGLSDWLYVYNSTYESEINKLESLSLPKIYLKPGQYISDVIDENGDAKPGVEVIV